MTIVQTEDNRNQEWRKSNIGSKMLEKMGWSEGKGIGKRNVNTTALRAVKRLEGLGIGAKRQTEGGPSESTGTFAAVLANLKVHHANSDDDRKKKKSSKKRKEKEAKKKAQKTKKGLSLPQNKVLAGHARKMRAAKFGAKSAEDLACIFGNTEVVGTATAGASSAFGVIPAVGESKKRSRSDVTKRNNEMDATKKINNVSSSSNEESEVNSIDTRNCGNNNKCSEEKSRKKGRKESGTKRRNLEAKHESSKKEKKEKKLKKSKKKRKE